MNVKKPNSADKLKAAQPDPTRRFADRVADYVKSRPRYPEPVLAYLQQTTDFSPADQVADVGSGTGILAELFLKNGNRVYGVEPNAEMRSAAEAALAGYANFFSVAGKAEASGLATKSVDLVTAGQAFHWFDAEKARVEFRRNPEIIWTCCIDLECPPTGRLTVYAGLRSHAKNLCPNVCPGKPSRQCWGCLAGGLLCPSRISGCQLFAYPTF